MRANRQLPRLLAALLAVGPCAWACAQESSYDEEYQNRIKSAGTVQTFADTPFGEQVDLYTGATSFEQVDLSLPGLGPEIRITRRAIKGDGSMSEPLKFSGFGDWELVVPQLTTLVPGSVKINSTTGIWRAWSPSGASDLRCSYMSQGVWSPPANYYGFHTGDIDNSIWWQGYQLEIPGAGSQTVLARSAAAPAPAAGTYPGVTNQHWQVGCLPYTTSGQAGESFVVLAPDGTKYFLTQMSFDTYQSLRDADPVPPYWYSIMPRNFARMKATRIEDRFGNYVTYGYTGDLLTSITGSDGRAVTIEWWADAPLVKKITANGRSWNYAYASRTAAGGTLSQVTLPDGSSWLFTGSAAPPALGPVSMSGCNSPNTSDPGPGITSTYTVRHPAGAIGVFRYSTRLRGQSYMPSWCVIIGMTGYDTQNPYFLVSALAQREASGPGQATGIWNYAYESHHASFDRDCAGNTCQSTTYTDLQEPDGTRTRYIHSTRHGALQGKLLRTEVYENGTTLKRTEDRSYNFAESDRPYPGLIGNSISATSPQYASENLVVLRKTTLTQQGRKFNWEIPGDCPEGLGGFCIDAFGRPTRVTRSSTP